MDNGELLKVFSRRVTQSELCLQKINLATVRKMNWSRERPEDKGKMGDSTAVQAKGNMGPK